MELVPKKYDCHIFVCVNEREEGECCGKRESTQIVASLRNYINQKGLFHKYNVSKSKCLGHCSEGLTIAIYPQGHIFKKVSVVDTQKIIEIYLPED